MRREFGNTSGVPVDVGRRIGARLIVGLFGMGSIIISFLGTTLFTVPSYNAGVLGAVAIYTIAVLIWQLVLMVKGSTNIGGFFLEFRYVRTDTGADATVAVLLKYLVQGFFEMATFGLGLISYLVSYRDGQHWMDRAFKLAAVHNDSGEAIAPGLGEMVAPPSPPRVMPVQMPQPPALQPAYRTDQPASPIDQMPDPSWQVAGQSRQLPAPTPGQPFGQAGLALDPVPGLVPMTPGSPVQHESIPASPFAEANPWALPVQGDESSAEPQPSAHPTQPPLDPTPDPAHLAPAPAYAALAEPQRPPLPTLNDETVVDSDPTVAEVVLDDGQRITVDSPVVLGRNPSAPPAYPLARCLSVVDESMRLSKTHLVLVPANGGVAVYDAGATNGVLVEIDGARTRLPAAEAHPIPEGAVVHFGGRSLRVAR